MTDSNRPPLGPVARWAVIVFALASAAPLAYLCLGRYSTPIESQPTLGNVPSDYSESIAGWPFTFYHTMQLQTELLPGESESVAVTLLPFSLGRWLADLAVVVAFAAVVGWITRRTVLRRQLAGRILSGLALLAGVVACYAVLMALIYVESTWHTAAQQRQPDEYPYRRNTGFDKRHRYFAEYLIAKHASRHGFLLKPTQLSAAKVPGYDLDRLREVLRNADLRRLGLAGFNLGPTELGWLERHRRLTSLELFNCQIDGDLQQTLARLPALTHLRLENCRSGGDVHLELSGLSQLRGLSVTTESQTGELPRLALDALPQLRVLNINGYVFRLAGLPRLEILSVECETRPDSLKPLSIESLPELRILGVKGLAFELSASNLPKLDQLRFPIDARRVDLRKKQIIPSESSRIRIRDVPRLSMLEIDCSHVESIVVERVGAIAHVKLARRRQVPQGPFSFVAVDAGCDRFSASQVALDSPSLDSLAKLQPAAVDLIECEITAETLLATPLGESLRQLAVVGPEFSGEQLNRLLAHLPKLEALIANCAKGPIRLEFPETRALERLGLVGEPTIESLGGNHLPRHIAVARYVASLSNPQSILRYAIDDAADWRMFRMASGEISRPVLDRLTRHSYSFDLYGRAMPPDDWYGIAWGGAKGLSVRLVMPDKRDVLDSWSPLADCVALGLRGSLIDAEQANRLLGGRTDWRALDFGETRMRVSDLTKLSQYNSLEYLSLARRGVDASEFRLLAQLPALKRLDLTLTRVPTDALESVPPRTELLEVRVLPKSFFGEVKLGEPVPAIRFVSEFSPETDRQPPSWGSWPATD